MLTNVFFDKTFKFMEFRKNISNKVRLFNFLFLTVLIHFLEICKKKFKLNIPSLTALSRKVYSVSGFNPWTLVKRSVMPDPIPTTPTVGGWTSIVYESALATDSHVRNKLLSVVESSVTRKLLGAGSAIPETCHIRNWNSYIIYYK